MLVLTTTQRLAEQLSTTYPNARILRLAQWLTGLCKTRYTLLSESQEHTVWQMIIAESIPHHSHAQQAQIASMAQQAWHLMTQWNLPITHPAFGNTNDTRLFKQWAMQFTQHCKQQGWLDASSAIELYIKDMPSAPEHIVLAGFTDLNPQQQRLLDALSVRGCKYELLTTTHMTEPTQLALADPETEWTTMARWASNYFTENPQHRIACIVPQLAENYLFIEDIFLKLNLPFTLSATQTLNKYPLIRCALLILSLDPFDQNQIHALKYSPFIKPENSIESMDFSQPTSLNTRSPSAWAIFFTQQLDEWGWPGDRKLDPTEMQLYEQWKTTLIEFSTLDAILSVISYDDALKRLYTLINATVFQPQEISNPIQILNPIEAIGLSFDAIWLMGIQDTTWPPAPRPNPFIPTILQRTLKMPYASAEQTLDFYRKLTTQLCAHTPNMIISYALCDTDGNTVRPTALIRHISEITLSNLRLSEIKTQTWDNNLLESVIDEWAPPALEEEVARSGTALFKNQAACPFRAFAIHRLGATTPQTTQASLTYAERGTLVHKILETIWVRLNNHTQLSEMSESELRKLIQVNIKQILMRFSQERPIPLKKKLIFIETTRLEKIISQWLMVEKERAFFTVKAVEKKMTLQLAKYPAYIRIDRIDELSDGTHLIIDYKTAACSDNSWYGDRPDEPQVPLYCIASQYPTSGACFAEITQEKSGFKGIISDTVPDIGINNLKPIADWTEQTKIWEMTLKNLVQQFENGYASVDPKNSTSTCQYCHLSIVCRIKENNT